MNRRSRIVALILGGLAMIALTAGYRATLTPVTLTVDDEARRVYTHQPTVALLLADLGISLRPEDRVLDSRRWIPP